MSSMNQNTVEVNLDEDSYQIDIGNNFLSKKDMEIFIGNREVCLVYDENVPQSFITDVSNIFESISLALIIMFKFAEIDFTMLNFFNIF